MRWFFIVIIADNRNKKNVPGRGNTIVHPCVAPLYVQLNMQQIQIQKGIQQL